MIDIEHIPFAAILIDTSLRNCIINFKKYIVKTNRIWYRNMNDMKDGVMLYDAETQRLIKND